MNEFHYTIDTFAGSDLFNQFIARHGDSIEGMGHWKVEVWRPDVDGVLQYLRTEEFHNGITGVGLNYLLGSGFHADTQLTTWYALLISATSFTALNSADTMSSHTGWVESIAYSESARVTWTCGSPSAGSITNSSQMVFTINADGTNLKGMGMTSVSTKSGTTGTLWATGLFASEQDMNNADVLKITYTVTLTATG